MNTENFREDILFFLKSGTTQQLLAKKAGVPQATLSDFLSGKTKHISSRHLFSLWPIVYGKPLIPDAGDD